MSQITRADLDDAVRTERQIVERCARIAEDYGTVVPAARLFARQIAKYIRMGESRLKGANHGNPTALPNETATQDHSKKPETFEEWQKKGRELLALLLECRDALPAISVVSVRLRNISPTLADRIEAAMEPWRIE